MIALTFSGLLAAMALLAPAANGLSSVAAENKILPNWVSPIAASDTACYRKTYIADTCASGYNSDNIATCWAQCPLDFPVECGMECIPQNDDCTLEVIDKVTSVAKVALTVASSGVLGELSGASKALQLGVKCGQKLFSVTNKLVGYADDLQTDFPDKTKDQLLYLMGKSDFVIKDLPTAVCTCLGLDVPTDKLDEAAGIAKVVDKVVEQVLTNGTQLLNVDGFMSFINDLGVDGSVQELDDDNVRTLKDIIAAGTTCGTNLQTIIDKVTHTVADLKVSDASSTVSSIRLALSSSELFTTEIPKVTNQCIQDITGNPYATRDTIRSALGVITDSLIDASVDEKGNSVSTADYILKVANMGLDAIAMFDPTGIADMLGTYIQPICGPTAFVGEIDDGSLSDALALRTEGKAFNGSYGSWNRQGNGVVSITFESTDTEDVTVVIHSGGQTVAKVPVPAGQTVTWTSTVAEMQDKTMYLDRWRPGFMGFAGSGGGSLNMWVPRSSAGGNLVLFARINVS